MSKYESLMDSALKGRLEKLGIGSIRRHIFFCGGPKCCSEKEGNEVWSYLKQRSRELQEEGVKIYRTKTTCLRVCQKGPIALVYPEGSWYGCVDIKGCEKIIAEHLVGGKPVERLLIATNPLEPLPDSP